MNNTTLYHYTSGQGLFGIINSSELHCSHITFLNDPTEHKYLDTVMEKIFLNNSDCKEIYETLFNVSYHDITYDFHDYYVLSFSRNSDSLSMWNYYSKGNGYNVGLNYESIIERNKTKLGKIIIVDLIYDWTKQYQTVKKFIKSFKKELLKIKNSKLEIDEDIERRFNSGLINFRLSFKHSAYAREEEVRILIAKPVTNESEVYYRLSTNGVIVEYVKLEIDLKRDLKSIMVHPQGTELHLSGIDRFAYSKIGELRITHSQIPFRDV